MDRLKLLNLFENVEFEERTKGVRSELTSQTKILKHLLSSRQLPKLPSRFRMVGVRTLALALARARNEREEAARFAELMKSSPYGSLTLAEALAGKGGLLGMGKAETVPVEKSEGPPT